MPRHAAPHPAEPPAPAARGVRKRLCACLLRRGMGAYERLIEGRKHALLDGLSGDIVEVGPGAGPNLPYLAAAAPRIRSYTALEPNAYLHAPLLALARSLKLPIDLRADAIGPGRAGLPDACADVVVCTLVLCSVPDQAAAVVEIARLLRPGGRFVFIEHVAAPHGTLLRGLQRGIRPVWRFVGDGCEPDRETGPMIRTAASGLFEPVRFDSFMLPVPVVAPHIAGAAIRSAAAAVR